MNTQSNTKGAVVITGTSTGIGRVTALQLAQEGYHVYACVRKPADGETLKAAAEGRLEILILDVAKPEQIQAAVEKVTAENPGGIYSLINNAGVNHIGPFEYLADDEVRKQMEVNVFGLFKTSQAFLPLLRRYHETTGRRAKLVNLGSIGSAIGLPWESFYHAGKFAVLGMSESLRFELQSLGVDVSVVMPGGIKTEFFGKTKESTQQAAAALPADAHPYYKQSLADFGRMTDLAERFTSKPEAVAQTILRILGSRKAGLKYLVGMDARSIYFMTKFVPTSLRHRIIRAAFGMK